MNLKYEFRLKDELIYFITDQISITSRILHVVHVPHYILIRSFSLSLPLFLFFPSVSFRIIISSYLKEHGTNYLSWKIRRIRRKRSNILSHNYITGEHVLFSFKEKFETKERREGDKIELKAKIIGFDDLLFRISNDDWGKAWTLDQAISNPRNFIEAR